MRPGRSPPTHDLRARRGRARGDPSASRADQAGEQIAAAITAIDDQAARPPPRGREPTDRVVLRACAARHDSTRGSSTRMQPVVGGSSGGAADAVTGPPPDVKAFLAMRLTGVLDRLFGLSAICAPNSAISASNSAISPGQRKAALRQFCRDFATYCGRGSQKTQLRTKAPTSRNPLDRSNSLFCRYFA